MSEVKRRDMLALAAYQEELARRPALRYLFFELTDRCNLRCRHCGSGCVPEKGTALPFEAVAKALEDTAAELNSADIMICLTGGEPLLYPELCGVIRRARRLGFPTGLTTNGTLIDEQTAEALVKAGLDTAAVSVDGTEAVHDAFRRSPGCFEKTVRGIRALKKAGLEPQAVTVVSRANLWNLEELAAFLKQEEIWSWRLTDVDPIGRAKEDRALLLDREEMKETLRFVRRMRFDPENDMEVTWGCAHFLGPEFEREARDFYFQCGAGTQIMSVAANGGIRACLDIERRADLVQGNVFRDNLMTVWKTGFGAFRRNRAEGSPVCGECGYKTVCRGVSAHTWDWDRKIPKYCFAKEEQGCGGLNGK